MNKRIPFVLCSFSSIEYNKKNHFYWVVNTFILYWIILLKEKCSTLQYISLPCSRSKHFDNEKRKESTRNTTAVVFSVFTVFLFNSKIYYSRSVYDIFVFQMNFIPYFFHLAVFFQCLRWVEATIVYLINGGSQICEFVCNKREGERKGKIDNNRNIYHRLSNLMSPIILLHHQTLFDITGVRNSTLK